MAAQSYGNILKMAREELSKDEQIRLAEELKESPSGSGNGGTGRTLYDALEKRGIIGSITDGPSDLSTNPKHMQGFGKDA